MLYEDYTRRVDELKPGDLIIIENLFFEKKSVYIFISKNEKHSTEDFGMVIHTSEKCMRIWMTDNIKLLARASEAVDV